MFGHLSGWLHHNAVGANHTQNLPNPSPKTSTPPSSITFQATAQSHVDEILERTTTRGLFWSLGLGLVNKTWLLQMADECQARLHKSRSICMELPFLASNQAHLVCAAFVGFGLQFAHLCVYIYIYMDCVLSLCVYTCIYGHPKVFINSCKGFAFNFSGSGQCAILLLSVQGMSSMHLPSWYLKSKLWSLVSEGLHCLGQLQLLHHTLKLEGAKRSFSNLL